MNILFISNDLNIFKEGSAVRLRMRTYAEEIALAGGTLHILSRAHIHQTAVDGPLILHGIRSNKLLSPWTLAHAAHMLILKENIVVVSAQDSFEHGWAALKAVRGTQAKLHIQIHTDVFSPWFTRGLHTRMSFLNSIRTHIAMRVLPHADSIRVVSQRIKNSLVEKFGAYIPEPSVIPIAVDATVPPKVELPSHAFSFALIAVGRLEPEKRIEDIIAAIALLKGSHPSLGMFIVGEGRERTRLERMVRQYGLTERIIFLGARADARGLMQSAQAFIQASAYEGYGLTLIEAALSRVPIITTDVGIVGEVFKDSEHALVSPVGNPASLAASIVRLIEDNALRERLALSAEARAKEHLATTDSSPRAMTQDILAAAQGAAGNPTDA